MSESIRIKIAKWLAPDLAWAQEAAQFWEASADRWSIKAMRRGDALYSITRLRTPKCAHGVKKACDIADQALSGEG